MLGKGSIEIDDLKLLAIDSSPLKNGSFMDGLTHWDSYVYFDAQAAVDAVNEEINENTSTS